MPSFWSWLSNSNWKALRSSARAWSSGRSAPARTTSLICASASVAGRRSGEPVRGRDQCLAIRRHLADQPYGQGLRRLYRATGKQHAQRLELAHRSHQALGAAGAGHHADTDFRLGEARRGTGDDQVAVHRQLAASAQGIALHGGDQRLAAGGEGLPVALHPALLDLQRGRLRQFVEIGAGGDAVPFPVRTMTRVSAHSSRRRTCSARASRRRMFRALSTAGRFSRNRATPCSGRSSSTSSGRTAPGRNPWPSQLPGD